MTSTKFKSLALLLVVIVILQGVKQGESNPHGGGELVHRSPGEHYQAPDQNSPPRRMGLRERIRNRIRSRVSSFRSLVG